MKIAVLNEFSQAPKNGIILKELKSVVEPMGHQVFNAAMEVPLTDQDVPEAYTQENPRLTGGRGGVCQMAEVPGEF